MDQPLQYGFVDSHWFISVQFTFSSSLKLELRRGEQNCCTPTCVHFMSTYSCTAVDSCQRTFHFQLHSMFRSVVK